MPERLTGPRHQGPSQLPTQLPEPSCSLSGFSGAGSSPLNTPVTGGACKTRPQPQQQINRRLPAQKPGEVSRLSASLSFIKLLAAFKTSAGFGWEPEQPGKRAAGGLLIDSLVRWD